MQSKHKHYSKKLFELNSKWTCDGHSSGWRHFRISAIRKASPEGNLEMMSVCDRSVRFFVSSSELKKNDSWNPGWL